MDYAALVAALPAETITAVSGTPQGLTASSQVEVGKSPSSSSDTERGFWLEPPDYQPLAATLGGHGAKYTFQLYMSKNDGTTAQLQVWADQIRAHFHGRQRPGSITDLLAAFVGEMVLVDSDDGDDVQCIIEVAFIGINRPGSG